MVKFMATGDIHKEHTFIGSEWILPNFEMFTAITVRGQGKHKNVICENLVLSLQEKERRIKSMFPEIFAESIEKDKVCKVAVDTPAGASIL